MLSHKDFEQLEQLFINYHKDRTTKNIIHDFLIQRDENAMAEGLSFLEEKGFILERTGEYAPYYFKGTAYMPVKAFKLDHPYCVSFSYFAEWMITCLLVYKKLRDEIQYRLYKEKNLQIRNKKKV